LTFTRKHYRSGEQRSAKRHAVDFSATITLDRGTMVRCQIKDFSVTGAQIVVPSVLGIPDEFILQAPTGQARRVRVQRRGIARLGVSFI
jgi:hypothetical protein